MSHVDDGTLHAYLDGELPAPERAALEIHIAQCATCGARLAEERSLIERASAVLGATRPSGRMIAPMFAQVSGTSGRASWKVIRSLMRVAISRGTVI